MKNLIKGVIYDMDGLIINSEPLWKIAEIESFKEQYQKIFDVLNKLETKQQNLCEKWCLLADKLNNYEEKFIVRKPTMGVM